MAYNLAQIALEEKRAQEEQAEHHRREKEKRETEVRREKGRWEIEKILAVPSDEIEMIPFPTEDNPAYPERFVIQQEDDDPLEFVILDLNRGMGRYDHRISLLRPCPDCGQKTAGGLFVLSLSDLADQLSGSWRPTEEHTESCPARQRGENDQTEEETDIPDPRGTEIGKQAIQTYQEEQEEIQERERKRLEQVGRQGETRFREIFGREHDSRVGLIFTIDGIRLSYHAGNGYFEYNFRCPRCKKWITHRRAIRDLKTLGEAILDPRPVYGHEYDCVKPERRPATDGLQSFFQFIAQGLVDGGYIEDFEQYDPIEEHGSHEPISRDTSDFGHYD